MEKYYSLENQFFITLGDIPQNATTYSTVTLFESAKNSTLAEAIQPPDWDSFIDEALAVGGFSAEFATHPSNGPISTRLGRLADGKEWQGSSDRLVVYWNTSPISLSGTMQSDLQTAADNNNIPLTINTDGTISLKD